jgi:aminocarboxymuconate-semialdehyde decarboxylase
VSVIDVHNHFYPPEYLAALREGPSAVTVTEDDAGNPVLHYPGDYNVCVPGHRDIAFRTGVMEHEQVRQVISLTTPGVHVEAPERAVTLARLVNDAFARVVREHRGRYHALATLPLNVPDAAVAELERAVDTLGLPGAMLFSNVGGVPLADARYEPLYAAADRRRAVLMIHPTHPHDVAAMTEYWLMPLVGFLADTTLAAAHLVFAGVPERYPRIRWILGHLGGAIPYLAERLDRGWQAFADCRRHIGRPPSSYLREHFWYDTVNFDAGALELAIRFAGAGHILAGSDYPHMIGSIAKMREAIGGLPIAEAAKRKILVENAEALLSRADVPR